RVGAELAGAAGQHAAEHGVRQAHHPVARQCLLKRALERVEPVQGGGEVAARERREAPAALRDGRQGPLQRGGGPVVERRPGAGGGGAPGGGAAGGSRLASVGACARNSAAPRSGSSGQRLWPTNRPTIRHSAARQAVAGGGPGAAGGAWRPAPSAASRRASVT